MSAPGGSAAGAANGAAAGSAPGSATVDAVDARSLWTLFEPLHAVTYFAPEARLAFEGVGLRGFWRGYFGGRAAPLGAVDAAPVIALFFNFAPAVVERALPAVWSLAAPEVALRARLDGSRAALARLLGAAGIDPDGDDVASAADLLTAVAGRAVTDGRALAAAHAALPVPGDVLGALWHAAGVLREHRGDGHVAALVAAGLTGLEVLVLRAGLDLDRELLQGRGWTDEEWGSAARRLVGRGLLDGEGRTTASARQLLADVETVTDRLAAQPWHDAGRAGDAAQVLYPLAAAVAAELPERTPIGLPRPERPGSAAGRLT